MPPFLKKGSFVFFAIDNTDFNEDTVDGKGTTHGTITTVYQNANVPGELIVPNLEVGDASNLSVLPCHILIRSCKKTQANTRQETVRVSARYLRQKANLGWIIAFTLSRLETLILSSGLSLTKLGALPRLPEVAYEWSALLAMMLQASQLNSLVVEDHPAVITFDMHFTTRQYNCLMQDPISKVNFFRDWVSFML